MEFKAVPVGLLYSYSHRIKSRIGRIEKFRPRIGNFIRIGDISYTSENLFGLPGSPAGPIAKDCIGQFEQVEYPWILDPVKNRDPFLA